MDQDLLWCEDCRRSLAGDPCPVHGTLHRVPDSPIPPRAILTAPHAVSIRRLPPDPDGRTVHGAFATSLIEERTVFGPVEAQLLDVPVCLGQDQFLLKKFRSGVETGYLDVSNDSLCNWLIYVRPARSYAEQNLVAYHYNDDIHFVTSKVVPVNVELKVWYAKDYAALMQVEVLPRDPVRIKEEPVVGAVSVIRSISDLRHIEKIQESGEDTVGVSSPVPHPLDTEDASSLAHIRSSRRKGARPQRVPQTAAQNGEASPSAATASAAPVIHLPIKEEITNNNVQPPYQPNDIFLIYENSGGIQQGSLLLVTPSAPILKQPFEFPVLNDSYLQPGTSGLTWANAHSGSSMTMANNGAYACKNSAKNPIVLRSSEESMDSGENDNSPQSNGSENGSRREHSLLHSSGGSRPYSCSYPACSKYFSSKYKLLRHELIHSQEKRHHCPLCHKKFHRKDHLNNHLKVHERSKVRLECLLCGCIFAKKWTYEKHLALHERDQGHPLNESQLLALEAAGGISGDEEDRKEDQIWPTMHQSHDSEMNDEQRAQEAELEPIDEPVYPPLIKKVPLNQKPSHPCEVCGKVFSASKDLRRHLQTHLGIKPNLCPYCPKKFTRKDHVRRHISTVHAGGEGGHGQNGRKSAQPLSSMAGNDIEIMA